MTDFVNYLNYEDNLKSFAEFIKNLVTSESTDEEVTKLYDEFFVLSF